MTEIEIETDAKIRKLNLRLQGQLQTIRTLETQLSDSHEQLESKNKQISQLSTKVKQLESKANNVASTPTAKPSQKTAETRNALKLEELKVIDNLSNVTEKY